MDLKINKPENLDTMKLFLLVHSGYDFDPTVLCVCDSIDQAKKRYKEHYAAEENSDFPWNGVSIVECNLNDWITYDVDKTRGVLE